MIHESTVSLNARVTNHFSNPVSKHQQSLDWPSLDHNLELWKSRFVNSCFERLTNVFSIAFMQHQRYPPYHGENVSWLGQRKDVCRHVTAFTRNPWLRKWSDLPKLPLVVDLFSQSDNGSSQTLMTEMGKLSRTLTPSFSPVWLPISGCIMTDILDAATYVIVGKQASRFFHFLNNLTHIRVLKYFSFKLLQHNATQYVSSLSTHISFKFYGSIEVQENISTWQRLHIPKGCTLN